MANTTGTWHDIQVDEADRAAWLEGKARDGLPVRVAVVADAVAGYATFGPFRHGSGYRFTAENSAYVHPDQRGHGIGRALLEDVIVQARANGLHALIGGIGSENAGSIALHERLGFTHVGLVPQVGVKFGRWLDLVLMQLLLDDGETPPSD